MSSKKVGQILKLFISAKNNPQRTAKTSVVVNKLGVLEDKFYDKDVQRSILIASTDSYDLVSSHNIEMPFGYLGENLLMDYNPYTLAIGTQLKIGDAVLEISQNCTICNHLTTIDSRIPSILKDDRGIFVKVVSGGKIRAGDEVYLLEV